MISSGNKREKGKQRAGYLVVLANGDKARAKVNLAAVCWTVATGKMQIYVSILGGRVSLLTSHFANLAKVNEK